MKLGVCYYPEHWPQAWWADDAAAMKRLGITRVRIGEFAWSRIEPDPGRFNWEWLDLAIETLHAQGLEIVLGTPTATPPKWLIDQYPDILATDARGRLRNFGSRRHYSFSSETYARETRRIVAAMADRYGAHPGIVAWQTDNEYGCHDTVEDYGPEAARAFRHWLKQKYKSTDELNAAWGNVFWSMEYRSFDEVDPPHLTVTEANPAHRLDFQRFSSDQVARYNRLHTDILREAAPGREIVHNFMGFFTAFDHHTVAADLDAATWDSYPLGFLEQGWWSDAFKNRFARQGHPDLSAFHHDLYRGVGRGRWQVMEQQPGPVNWASFNPAPLPGMVRLWTWEAFAHGAEVVSYFRWRQAPFAQEQMHAGLHRPDRSEDVAAHEARAVAAEMQALGTHAAKPADVALVFDYQSEWVTQIQPQGRGFSAFRVAFEWYETMRSFGLDVDVVGPDVDLSGYGLILLPCAPIVSADLAVRLQAAAGIVVAGARSGSKTSDFQIPSNLAPGVLADLFGVRVERVESLRPGLKEPTPFGAVERWLEHVSGPAQILVRSDAGRGVHFAHGRAHYIAGHADAALRQHLLGAIALAAGQRCLALPDGLRLRRLGDVQFAFNYALEPVDLADHIPGSDQFAYKLGGRLLPPAGVAAWKA
jgi:beta-galactosidase